MRLLALDPGKETGWLVLEIDGTTPVDPEVIEFGSFRVEKMIDAYNEVVEICECYGLKPGRDDLIIERLMVYGQNTQGERHRVEAIIELVAQQRDLRFEQVHPGTLKTFIAGKGNAPKPEVRRVLKEYYQLKKANEHIWDALGVGLTYANKKFGFTF